MKSFHLWNVWLVEVMTNENGISNFYKIMNEVWWGWESQYWHQERWWCVYCWNEKEVFVNDFQRMIQNFSIKNLWFWINLTEIIGHDEQINCCVTIFETKRICLGCFDASNLEFVHGNFKLSFTSSLYSHNDVNSNP